MAKHIITEKHVQGTKLVLNPEVQITPEGGRTETAELINFVGPFAGIPSFTRQALRSHIGTTFDEFFKQLRETSNYRREWEFLQLLPDKGSCEWVMIALSLCAQFAVETSVFHPYLAEDARKWLKAKFLNQGVLDGFDNRWEIYRNTPADELMTPGPFYLRISEIGLLQTRWVGSYPKRPSSSKYQLTPMT